MRLDDHAEGRARRSTGTTSARRFPTSRRSCSTSRATACGARTTGAVRSGSSVDNGPGAELWKLLFQADVINNFGEDTGLDRYRYEPLTQDPHADVRKRITSSRSQQYLLEYPAQEPPCPQGVTQEVCDTLARPGEVADRRRGRAAVLPVHRPFDAPRPALLLRGDRSRTTRFDDDGQFDRGQGGRPVVELPLRPALQPVAAGVRRTTRTRSTSCPTRRRGSRWRSGRSWHRTTRTRRGSRSSSATSPRREVSSGSITLVRRSRAGTRVRRNDGSGNRDVGSGEPQPPGRRERDLPLLGGVR